MKAGHARSVFDSAAFALRFGTPSPPPGYALSVRPPVRIGVSLAAEEAEESRLRGGDGMAAALNGGVMALAREPPAAPASANVPSRQKALSVLIRARDPSGAWGAPLACEMDQAGRLRFSLSATKDTLSVLLFTDFRAQPLELSASLSLVGASAWHDIVFRYSGPHAELFVDGIAVDEEWPVGCLAGGPRGRFLFGACGDARPDEGFRGLICHAAAWDRALDDAEIDALSGGPARAAARGWALPSSDRVQYRAAPRGGFVGDCLPFFHDGVYHFYYLLDRRHHRSKYGLGAHQWAHSSSRDLRRWEHHPLAIPITDEREGSICTGSMFFHEGTWYAFYATRLADRSEHICVAVGGDGIHFTKSDRNPLASPRPPYRHGPFRDPHVFQDPATGLFHMLATAELEQPSAAGRGGCLAHLVSRDLLSWEQEKPFLVTGYGDQPECPELFAWRGWYYLVFSHFGTAHYRAARSPWGPWARPRVDCLDGPLARVMKSAAFTADRRIGAFFLAEDGYAGRAVFREIIQNADGTLGSAWPSEMVPGTGAAAPLTFQALGQGVSGGPARITIESPQGFSAAALKGLPPAFRASFRVQPGEAAGPFGAGLETAGNVRDALLLEVDPARRKVGWKQAGQASWKEEEAAALYEMTGLDEPFSVDLIVFNGVIDVCIDGRRTLINRAPSAPPDTFLFWCHESTAVFEEIAVHAIEEAV